MSDTEATEVAVIDRHGSHHSFDADDFKEDGPYVNVTKGGERVARFEPGYTGVYKRHAYKGTAQGPVARAAREGGDAQ